MFLFFLFAYIATFSVNYMQIFSLNIESLQMNSLSKLVMLELDILTFNSMKAAYSLNWSKLRYFTYMQHFVKL